MSTKNLTLVCNLFNFIEYIALFPTSYSFYYASNLKPRTVHFVPCAMRHARAQEHLDNDRQIVDYKELVERIRGELNDVERVVSRALNSWAQAQKTSAEQDVYLDSVALNLHGFYSGLERLFELSARHVDRSLPEGGTWHRDLLDATAKDLADSKGEEKRF